MSNPEEAWKLLGQVFEKRHILSHELATDMEMDKEETRRLLLMAQEFMSASAEWVEQTIDPNRTLSREEREKRWAKWIAELRLDAKTLHDRVRRNLKDIEGMDGARKATANVYESVLLLMSTLRKSGAPGLFPPIGEAEIRMVEVPMLQGLVEGLQELNRSTDRVISFKKRIGERAMKRT